MINTFQLSRANLTPIKKQPQAKECPIAVSIAVIGGKWKPLLIWVLLQATAPLRFGELHQQVPGMALKVLSRQLKELETDGIVHRKAFAEVPPRVEYSLTKKGKSLSKIMQMLSRWSRRHLLAPS